MLQSCMMMTERNILSLWNGRQEKGMKNQDLSVLLSMIQKKKRLLDIQNHFGEAEQTGDVLRRRTDKERRILLYYVCRGRYGV